MPPSILNPESSEVRISRSAKILLRVFIYLGMALVVWCGIRVTNFFLWARCFELRAFRTPSDSMCPGICENEKVIAGMDAFNARAPQRGEVILFERDDSGTKFIKRVVAVAGDRVTPGPGGTVLVNGKPVQQPAVCGHPIVKKKTDSPVPDEVFAPLTVPPNSFFVVGDNVNESFDSRYFGPVNLNQVRRKVLLIYWSLGQSRIGCRVT